jgi:hypothetical protein
LETTKRTTKNSETSSSNRRKDRRYRWCIWWNCIRWAIDKCHTKVQPIITIWITPANLQFQLQTLGRNVILI